MMSSAKPPSFRIEIGTQLGSRCVTSLGRGEIRECVNRGIISAPAGVGQGSTALIQNGTWSKASSLRRCCGTSEPARSQT
jgi:hypothetical protein